ncbi:MAG: phage tail assembly protein [Pseudomonadota bacterium]
MATTIDLSQPITRGKKKINQLKLPKLTVPMLKGFMLADILGLDFTIMPELIGRLAKISEVECEQIEPYDLAKITKVIASDLTTAPDKPDFIDLRKPDSGNLRGVSLMALLHMDVDSMAIVVPRISSVTKEEFIALEPYQLLQAGKDLSGFFVNPPS